ncbi:MULTISPECIES: hypothetical protein [unclassified Mesorhizobium]|uniref:hypothetical protein n=1 Tax=unclassified Mesorhizobium TaxID=325217 RepID=UPI001AEEAD26|nr:MULTISPECIES: hypothetical protein [unclassified Mesorhizobium]MBZ9894597.1 hypothetical protein [Mesorhizobium sp. BR1-1-6]
MSDIEGSAVKDGDRIDRADIAIAVTRAPFAYEDGATQEFYSDGRTVYTDAGGRSSGEWKVDNDGRFQSFWPPSVYTTYDVFWIAGSDGKAVGVRFTDPISGATFDGRYAPTPA